MNYHGIRGVKKEVCTAEQKVAYNLVFSNSDIYSTAFKKICATGTGVYISNAITDLANQFMSFFRNSYSYVPDKFDEDAIFSALMAGLKDYMLNPFIATSYAQIGQAFPALYLNKNKKDGKLK